MLPNIRRNDEQLSHNDIRQLENAAQLAHFFARLGYNVDGRINIPDYTALGLGSDDLRQYIYRIERVGADPEDGDIVIYLFEVRSVTAKLRNEIARRFRERPENALLVLTKEYEELEFVLLERVITPSQSRGQALKQAIRPIPLTVNRQNPSTLARRVLQRFTFTEADSVYQWEKLRSAYRLAQSSEEYFNNRALFSDYYLNHRLPFTPEWNEDVRTAAREVNKQIVTARQTYTRQPERVIRKGLYEPLFKLLGFDYLPHKAADSSEKTADYLLFAPGDHTKPIAAALCYVWNRNLDDVDETRDGDGTPYEIPGASVVSLLQAQVAPWVIVTNGNLWRLHSATASNKATNYYEIDLEEAIHALDRETALKYWWLLFRRQAFTGFLDQVLKQSADYAKELGERLKDRVFVQIFPQFAKGFIADMRQRPHPGSQAHLPSSNVGRGDGGEGPTLEEIFSGTMTFLYRLMFVLYAESLELLPVHEANGYHELSLRRLKHEIAQAAGTILDSAPDQISKRYTTSSTTLYDRLKALFAVIDRGSDELNMPTYNGGLFSSQSPEGTFLESYAIGDRWLALGLDRLTRDVDTRTQALAMIDFKSLGVRQLGSIYEGLLEFKLRIADQKLAVTKEKGKEVYQPFANVKKPLATINKGDVYLENDKRERKATGSYYTPDYIVKYIVQHTVGPVLDRKFAELEPRLRSAQKGYRDYAKLVEARKKSLSPSSQTLLPQGEKGFSTPNPDSPLPNVGAGLGVREKFDVPPAVQKRMVEIARVLRRESTRSEDMLWQALRNQQLEGRKFRRQQPIGAFVLDFYCPEERLAVEIDGPIHETQREADHERQNIIESLGIRFVRVTAKQVEDDLLAVLATIRANLLPSPLSGRGAGGEGQSPAVFWRSPAMQQLADDCLNVRVLDPAMGSGHFLVEVVDYVSNRLISFLNGWSDNPVWALVEQTRADILSEMERQHVAIDADRLTRVALLKRAVLKRCVYGVDLNQMAVELAKVSLWLDAFTLGAPLSFLDHHLKWGNSLIGARIKDVQQYLDMRDKEQIDMFSGSKFTGVMLATDLMRQVSYLSDNTIEQSRQSAAQFQQASDHLAPYKRVLDVYTSRYFGNGNALTPGPSPKQGEGSKRARASKTDYVRLFLRDPQTESWLHDSAAKLDDSLIPATQIAATALRAAQDKRFFHWELEFPEVFFAPSTPGGQDVQLVAGGGFDAVVGNPPYGVLSNDTDYLRVQLPTTSENSDVYVAFLESSTRLASSDVGHFGLIVPLTWQTGINYWIIRKHLATNCSFERVVNLPYDIFPDAYVDTGVFTARNSTVKDGHVVRTINYPKSMKVQPTFVETEYKEVEQQKWLVGRKVVILDPPKLSLLQKVSTSDAANTALNSITTSGRGILADATDIANEPKDGRWKPFFTGYMNRYEIEEAEEYVLFGPNLRESPGSFDVFTGQRMLVRRLVNRQDRIMAVDAEATFVTKKDIYFFKVLAGQAYNTAFLTALVNSQLLSFLYLEQDVAATKDDFRQITLDGLRSLPIRRITFTTPAAERARLTQGIIARYDSGDNAAVVAAAQAAISAEQTDVVHDLLAHLAGRMIDLNKAKQAEVKRFLGWLETRLGIAPGPSTPNQIPPPAKGGPTTHPHTPHPTVGEGPGVRGKGGAGSGVRASGIDSLKGKSIIGNYLGDYQKGEAEKPWREFRFRLHENRTRFGVSLAEVDGEIEREYEQSVQTLLPIKRDLARTDALIDKIVYRLYGLTDAEIELIERPQYEQALTEAKAQVVADEEITDNEEKIARIADKMLPAAQRFFERVEPRTDEDMLDSELPNWRSLPPAAPTFLLTGDYNLRTMPEHMDFSSSVIPYTKAVEVVLEQRIFAPFRAAYTDADAQNKFLQGYMRGEKELTLGSYMIILSSTKETALRSFINRQIADAANRVWGADGLVTILDDTAMRDIRNKAAHDDVLTRADAQQIRAWAISILGRV